MRDPYTVLGVDRDADQPTIRKAFKKLARRYHPDINQADSAEDRFKEVNGAYDVLGDEKKRKLYDQFGEASTRPGFDEQAAQAFGRGRGHGAPFDFNGGFEMDDLLGSIFGAGGGQRQRRGADQSVQITVDFMTTVMGGETQISLRRGTRTDSLRVPVPAGARDGGKVRLKGQGAPPPGGGQCGDLLVQLKVRPHPILTRSGDDLEIELPITLYEAITGAAITVPTPTGDVKLTIPPEAKNGARLRLKGRGIQRKKPGHLYLILRPIVPITDDPDLLEAAKQMSESADGLRDTIKL
jgi:DnaJ-class molecular chaperone